MKTIIDLANKHVGPMWWIYKYRPGVLKADIMKLIDICLELMEVNEKLTSETPDPPQGVINAMGEREQRLLFELKMAKEGVELQKKVVGALKGMSEGLQMRNKELSEMYKEYYSDIDQSGAFVGDFEKHEKFYNNLLNYESPDEETAKKQRKRHKFKPTTMVSSLHGKIPNHLYIKIIKYLEKVHVKTPLSQLSLEGFYENWSVSKFRMMRGVGNKGVEDVCDILIEAGLME